MPGIVLAPGVKRWTRNEEHEVQRNDLSSITHTEMVFARTKSAVTNILVNMGPFIVHLSKQWQLWRSHELSKQNRGTLVRAGKVLGMILVDDSNSKERQEPPCK